MAHYKDEEQKIIKAISLAVIDHQMGELGNQHNSQAIHAYHLQKNIEDGIVTLNDDKQLVYTKNWGGNGKGDHIDAHYKTALIAVEKLLQKKLESTQDNSEAQKLQYAINAITNIDIGDRNIQDISVRTQLEEERRKSLGQQQSSFRG